MSDSSEREPKAFTIQEGWLLMAGFIVVSLTFAAFVGLVNKYAESIALPMLSIAGIILLLICLTGIAYVFARAGLQDKTQALGLPPGTIQSVIALSLIVLFAILSVFLFNSMASPSSLRQLKNLELADRNDQVAKLGSSFAGWEKQIEPEPKDGKPSVDKFTVFVRDPGIEARNDVGKQLIVLIGTLMTSAVSFYFGSRATVAGAAAAVTTEASARGKTDPTTPSGGPPVIKTIGPEGGIARAVSTAVTITGSALSKVTNVVIRSGKDLIPVTSLVVSETELTCKAGPAPAAAPGNYDVVLMAGDKEATTKQAGLKVV